MLDVYQNTLDLENYELIDTPGTNSNEVRRIETIEKGIFNSNFQLPIFLTTPDYLCTKTIEEDIIAKREIFNERERERKNID